MGQYINLKEEEADSKFCCRGRYCCWKQNFSSLANNFWFISYSLPIYLKRMRYWYCSWEWSCHYPNVNYCLPIRCLKSTIKNVNKFSYNFCTLKETCNVSKVQTIDFNSTAHFLKYWNKIPKQVHICFKLDNLRRFRIIVISSSQWDMSGFLGVFLELFLEM